MCTFANTEHVALRSICLSNAGVKAFERGDLDKAIRYMTWALHPDLAMSNSESKDRRMSKKTLMKVIKSQAHAFLPDQFFELRRSSTFGRRRNSREHPLTKRVTDATEQSSFYSYRRLISVKASNSVPILRQTSQDQLRAIFLANLAICYHFYAGDICKAKCSYELAVAAASDSGDLLVELVVWNNLLQLHSDDLLEEKAARACMVQLEQKLSDPRASDLLSMLGRHDRRAFLLNVVFFSFPGTIAPAA
ncbi:hypothetical protein MHU86_1109 [Fragilaria crotonensis]|nr:hypothetical protein MHU86_1109 [Fragilaria crotonensis]